MKTLIKTKQAKAIAFATALLGLSISSKAQILPQVTEGNSPVTLASTALPAGDSYVTGTSVTVYVPGPGNTSETGNAAYAITVTEGVYNDTALLSPSGKVTLDFVYSISLGSSVNVSTEQQIFSFAPNFVTNVGYLANTNSLNTSGQIVTGSASSFVPPYQATRASSGELSIDYATGELAPGATSDVIVVQTDAGQNNYDQYGYLYVDGQSVNNLYEPNYLLAPAPEPTGALFGAALLGGVLVSRRRQNKAQRLELSAV